MANTTPNWESYACFQRQLRNDFSLDDRTWGLETALNLVLDPHFSIQQSIERQFRIATGTGARRERYQAELRYVHRCELDDTDQSYPDPLETLAVRRRLSALQAQVSDDDWQLLIDVAFGTDYAELAISRKCTAGNLRTRVTRLRQAFVHFVN